MIPRTTLASCAACLMLSLTALAQTTRERKALIIGIDGVRADALQAANAPAIDALVANGAVSWECLAEDITISGPCWSSILTGVHRTKHGVTDNTFSGARYDLYPHFFARLESLCDISTASLSHWAPINTQILQGGADVVQSGLSDAGIAAAAVSLMQSGDPDVVFLHFDDCDHAGHSYGFDPSVPQYIAAIETTDSYVAQVTAAIHARPTADLEDWLVIVVSDHGGTIDGSHGRNIPEHRLVGLIVSGISSRRGIITPAPTIADVPATVFAFLGLPVNSSWNWDGAPVGLDMANSPSMPFGCKPPPPPPIGACCLPSGRCIETLAGACAEQRGSWSGVGTTCGDAGCAPLTLLAAQDFNGLPLGPNVDEPLAGANVWTSTPPAGWSVDNSQLPTGGVTEWRGWSFASPSWWSQTAGDQERSRFTKATGAAAIADPDEWDDLPHAAGTYNSFLRTPPIPLANTRPGSARIAFDSSWRPEPSQQARLRVSFDDAPFQTLFLWDSNPGPDFKPDAANETVVIPVPNPAGAAAMVLEFGLLNAGNNWWWAVDNIEVHAEPVPARRLLLLEDFESVPLGPNVDEPFPADRVWSGSPPDGWQVDDSGVPGVGNPAEGITEWEGWAFTDRAWWVTVAADQNRSQFTRASGAIAVADPDEWDDLGNPEALGSYNARLHTAAIPLSGVAPGSVMIDFDSSWRFEGLQQAVVSVSYDNGPPQQLLRWDSQPGANFKPDATNEHVSLAVANPVGASSMHLTFALLNARNNWWWAFDNLAVTGAAPSCPCDVNDDGSIGSADFFLFLADFFSGDADFNHDGGTTSADFFDFLACFFGAPGHC